MHERALVSRTASELLDSLGDERVDSIVLSIGPDTDTEVVQEAWRSATAGTSIAVARLELTQAKHELVCIECGAVYHGGKLSLCPQCGGNGLVVERAPEVAVAGLVRGRAT